MRMTVVIAGGLELVPGIAEEALHGGNIEAAGDLVRACHGEVLAGNCEKTAGLELVLEGLHLGFVGLERQVGAADRVGECFVREIVESAKGICSLGHDLSSWLGLGLPRCFQHLGGPTFLCYHGFDEASIRDNTEKEAPRTSPNGKGRANRRSPPTTPACGTGPMDCAARKRSYPARGNPSPDGLSAFHR